MGIYCYIVFYQQRRIFCYIVVFLGDNILWGIKRSTVPSLTLFAFHTNKKQYVDILHTQKKKRNAPSDAQ